MNPEQTIYLAFLAFASLAIFVGFTATVLKIGRYLGGREDHEAAYLSGYAAGRRDERADAARDPLMPRSWAADEATYPTIMETLPDGSHRICTPRRPQPVGVETAT